MPTSKFTARVTVATMCLAASAAVQAEENFVKPAETPAPTAGPTVAAAQEFCGDPSGKAEDLIQRYSTKDGLKQVYKSTDYIAFADDDKSATQMYTFTTKGHPAYPSIVCRKMVKEGEFVVGKMAVVCDGGQDACDRLKNDFNVLNAETQLHVNDKINETSGEKK
jgi:hypothetical protein